MDDKKVKQFITLAGQKSADNFTKGDPKQRELGAQLLLSETLEYVIKGLGVIPSFNGTKITDANCLSYSAELEADKLEMADGLSDVAYTMFWNSATFGIPLEEAFDLVCNNNLEKFVKLKNNFASPGELPPEAWHCGQNIYWPPEVKSVYVIKYQDILYAVGKDTTGKVRKPSSYIAVDLSTLVTT